MVSHVRDRNAYTFCKEQDVDVESMRPAIERALKEKFEAITANHPAGYWERIGNALSRLVKA